MSFVEALFIAVALAMDCFTVSISCGVHHRRMGTQVWVMALMFGVFQALMTLLGWAAVDAFNEAISAYGQWVTFALLLMVGGKMIWDGSMPKESPTCNIAGFTMLLFLSFATSIDALAVGCSFVGMGQTSFSDVALPVTMIGLVSFLLTIVGKYLGVSIGHRFNWPMEELGGLILIVIGVKAILF